MNRFLVGAVVGAVVGAATASPLLADLIDWAVPADALWWGEVDGRCPGGALVPYRLEDSTVDPHFPASHTWRRWPSPCRPMILKDGQLQTGVWTRRPPPRPFPFRTGWSQT